ncbi:hypothetical protein F0169_20375 [Pseudomonas sp. MAFF 212408]|uniref:Uncharacterized protein n=1 Tax=Pseudomonas kitaguniensis TaxID=2607908 RepID=A0A5N7KR27_9PSED|nr:hypothetical protein [Pseudomonas kitaguniensis]MPR04225.1 hypothetical protein [Pseudomonas kitaguniensis]
MAAPIFERHARTSTPSIGGAFFCPELISQAELGSYQTTNNLLFLLLKFIQVWGFGFECISVLRLGPISVPLLQRVTFERPESRPNSQAELGQTVGGGLLPMAVGQSIHVSTVKLLSGASPLPQKAKKADTLPMYAKLLLFCIQPNQLGFRAAVLLL